MVPDPAHQGPAYGIVEGDQIAILSAAPLRAPRAHRRAPCARRGQIPAAGDPLNFYAAGLNYRAHIEWRTSTTHDAQAAAAGRYRLPLGERRWSAAAPTSSSRRIRRAGGVRGRAGAVVGKKAKHLPEKEALGCIAGYTLGNDLSERAFQRSDRTLWRAKNIDTFKRWGPSSSGHRPMAQRIGVRVNGRMVSEYETRT